MKIVLRVALLFTCVPVLYLSAVFIILTLSKDEYYNDINKHIETAFSSTTGSSEPDLSLMSHRMIASDIQDGLISPQNAKRAFSNTAGYFNEVKRECLKENTHQTKDILSCANKILGNHFYYYPARETAYAWAGHYSDCDLNVYLLLDALHLFNKTASIVYAPGHAFLSWKDEQTGLPAWWETTSEANHGRPADLALNFYQKTLEPFYYRPQSAAFAERFYTSVVTLNSLNMGLKDNRLKDIIKLYPDNPFVEDLEYENKTSLTPADVAWLQARFKTDMSSVTKKQLLANYYQKKGNAELAKHYANRIDIDSCDTDCRPLMIMVSPVNRFWFMASDRLSKHVIHNSHGEFAMDKRKYPITAIKKRFYDVAIILIIMLALRGAPALYSDLKLIRTREK